MVLWGSVITLLASLAGLVTLGSTYVSGMAARVVAETANASPGASWGPCRGLLDCAGGPVVG
jgi:hypothetical protein